jgi:hypothetical protein
MKAKLCEIIKHHMPWISSTAANSDILFLLSILNGSFYSSLGTLLPHYLPWTMELKSTNLNIRTQLEHPIWRTVRVFSRERLPFFLERESRRFGFVWCWIVSRPLGLWKLSPRCGSVGVCCIFLAFSLWWQLSSLVKVLEGCGCPWSVDGRVSGRVFSLLDFWRLDLQLSVVFCWIRAF